MTSSDDSTKPLSFETDSSDNKTGKMEGEPLTGCNTPPVTDAQVNGIREVPVVVPDERLASALRAVGDAVILHDRDLLISWMNDAAKEMFGLIVGRYCYRASKGREAPCDGCSVLEVFEDGQTRRCEAFAPDPKGGRIPCVLTTSPILNSRGEVVSVVKILTDISSQKSVEKKLEDTKQLLELERTALKQKNLVLEEVLEKFEDQKKRIQVQISTNVDKVVMPAIKQIQKKLGPKDRHYLDLLESSLNDLTAPFAHHLDSEFSRLSAGEIEICNMVKHGMSSKEIASARNVSVQTISVQRKRIRKKLGIAHKSINLYSYLQSR